MRWLRPEFQNPSGAKPATQEKLPKQAKPTKASKAEEPEETEAADPAPASKPTCPWPKKLPEQIAAVRDLLSKGSNEWTVAEVAGAFKSANKAAVEEVLESLAALGILAAYQSRAGRRWKRTRPGS